MPRAVIEQRLKRACKEIRHYKEYDYLIVNDDLGSSIHELESIIVGRTLPDRCQDRICEIDISYFWRNGCRRSLKASDLNTALSFLRLKAPSSCRTTPSRKSKRGLPNRPTSR